MNTFFFAILLISCYFLQTSNASKVSIICFGPLKDASKNVLDPAPFNLEMVQYTFNKSLNGSNLTTDDVNFYPISDDCKADFDWQIESKKKLENRTDEFVLHIGPLCEYAELDAANSEVAFYIRDNVITSGTKNDSKYGRHLFVTPTIALHIVKEDLMNSHYSNRTNNQSRLPLFVSLNSNIELYSELIFNFSVHFLSPYTSFLCPVQEYLGNSDRFCLHLTDVLLRKSRRLGANFVRFRYFSPKNELGWLDIWHHILQRSRYVVFCGYDHDFLQWLMAGKNLWQPYKVENFVILFLKINLESSNYVTDEESEDELFEQLLTNISSIGNIKILNIRAPVECDDVSDFCQVIMKNWQNLFIYPQNESKLNKFNFKNKLLFHMLGVYQLFAKMFKDVENFWKHATNEKDFETVYKINKEIEVFELNRNGAHLKRKRICSFQRIDNNSVCHLAFVDGIVPLKVPAECGYDECFRNETLNWTNIIYAVTVVIGAGILIASISVLCYLRYRRAHAWSVAPLGEVLIKIEEIRTTAVHIDEIPLKFGIGKKTKSNDSSSQQIIRLDPTTMEPVLGVYRSTPVVVYPFKVAKNRVRSVDSAVMKLRSLTLENVAQIHGYLIQTAPLMHGLVMEYGEHGILLTLLKLDELDLALKLPLLADLCRALEHIHKSSLKYHGNLSSWCCVVDSHFVLKVQLTEFSTLKKFAPDESGIDEFVEKTFNKLWSAPEVLRNETNVDLQLADIYSFGIIAHEIIYQKGPFFVSRTDLAVVHVPTTDGPLPKTPNDIAYLVIKILQNKNRRQIRPTFVNRAGEEAVMMILKEMIKTCWDDNPTQRSSLSKIIVCVKKVMHEMRIVNVFGSMVERLEFYSKHLQDAVEMKADKVEQERHRVRHVLEQLFPGIAKSLINGEKPKPVEYKNICVYFNDLVGFTKICSVNTPATVVKFLNTLFLKYDGIIEMYAIHPVTRIGDAYMLVSGIPDEGKDSFHASEIAQAALQLVEAVRTTEFDYVVQNKNMQIRTGIASGRAATGVVGTEIPSFGICGDAVVVAAKMENSSEAMKILVANSSFVLLKDEFDFEPIAKEVKLNSTTIIAHWLKGMKKVSKILLDKRLDGKKRPERKVVEEVAVYA